MTIKEFGTGYIIASLGKPIKENEDTKATYFISCIIIWFSIGFYIFNPIGFGVGIYFGVIFAFFIGYFISYPIMLVLHKIIYGEV